MNSPALGAHEQHAVDVERDAVLEQLAPGRGGRELGRDRPGLDLGDERLSVALDEIVGAKLELDLLAVDEQHPLLARLASDDGVAGGLEQAGGALLASAGSRCAPNRAAAAEPALQRAQQKQRDQRTDERGDEHAPSVGPRVMPRNFLQ